MFWKPNITSKSAFIQLSSIRCQCSIFVFIIGMKVKKKFRNRYFQTDRKEIRKFVRLRMLITHVSATTLNKFKYTNAVEVCVESLLKIAMFSFLVVHLYCSEARFTISFILLTNLSIFPHHNFLLFVYVASESNHCLHLQ